MGTITFVYSCGHEHHFTYFLNPTQTWDKISKCPDCKAKEKEEYLRWVEEAAAWPALTGTAEQVAAATERRKDSDHHIMVVAARWAREASGYPKDFPEDYPAGLIPDFFVVSEGITQARQIAIAFRQEAGYWLGIDPLADTVWLDHLPEEARAALQRIETFNAAYDER